MHSCLIISFTSVVSICDTYENNFGIKYKFAKHSDGHLSFKFFQKRFLYERDRQNSQVVLGAKGMIR